jgi:hypothetical protein
VTLQAYAESSLRTTEGFFHLFDMFRELLKYRGKIENIKKAYNSALALGQVLLPTDPLLIMSLKTRIVYQVLNGNIEAAMSLGKKLGSYDDSENCIRQFLDMAFGWAKMCLEKEERKYIYKERFGYDGKDIWILILQNFIYRSMEDDFNQNIAGSKVIVFVEGITDLFVFKEFKEKILPKEKIHFIDIEGFTNAKYYAESKIVEALKVPTYLIFDGDTREEKKHKIINTMKRVPITSNHIYTLCQNSIENYLLNPRVITLAFPQKMLCEKDIQDFLEKTKNKKNKKRVLQFLFRQFKIGSYTKESAKQIASKFEIAEIDSELELLLSKITRLENM